MKLPSKRTFLWLAGGLLLLAVLVIALRPTPWPVDLAQASRGPLQVELAEEGETRVRDRFLISAPVAGRVLRIDLEPGDPVSADETVLATFEPAASSFLDARGRAEAEARVRSARDAVGRAKADRQRAQAELDFWQAEAKRIQRLAEQGIVSQGDAEAASLELRTRQEALQGAGFAVRAAEHELEAVRAVLMDPGEGASGTLRLTSPVDGAVLRRLRESEAVVPAGEPLIEVGDPADLEIVADFLSRDAVRMRPGQPVIIDQWGGEEPLKGRVKRVEPAGFLKISALGVEEQRVNVIIDFDDPQAAASLGDGYRVEVRVVVWQGEDVLKVPMSALFRSEGAWAVFQLENGEVARLRKIEIGHRNAFEAEVLSGLEAGATVLVHPSDDVEDGTEVAEREV